MAFTDPFDTNVHSGGTGAVTPNIADQFVPEVWGQAILDVFQQKIMMKNVGTDLSPNVAEHGDKIHLPHIGVPELSAFTHGAEIAADVTSGGSMTSQETALTISEYNVASVYVPDIVKSVCCDVIEPADVTSVAISPPCVKADNSGTPMCGRWITSP